MPADNESRCLWPPLTEPFATALQQAVGFIFRESEPVGVIATGTIVRGNAHQSSDLDVHVVHLAPYRRRIQRYFSGVPAEILINPPSAIREYFAEEDRTGRRVTAHMLATGFTIFEADPVVEELKSEASQWLAKETRPSEADQVSTRYTIASQLEDAFDVLATDETTATLLLSESVVSMLEFLCKAEYGQIPRRRDIVSYVGKDHPAVATRAAEFFRTHELSERVRLATEIADCTIGVRGFFEWDSGPISAPG